VHKREKGKKAGRENPPSLGKKRLKGEHTGKMPTMFMGETIKEGKSRRKKGRGNHGSGKEGKNIKVKKKKKKED